MRKKLALALAIATLIASAPLLSACYTAQGAGEDLSAAGRGLTNQSAQHTHYYP
jgi:predicted small secreted protein